MMSRTTWLGCVALLAVVTGCASLRGGDPANTAHREAMTTFVLVRHAEKATDDPKDPSLSDVGRARAARLLVSFDGVPVTAVYATGYRRTQATAQPTAGALALATASPIVVNTALIERSMKTPVSPSAPPSWSTPRA